MFPNFAISPLRLSNFCNPTTLSNSPLLFDGKCHVSLFIHISGHLKSTFPATLNNRKLIIQKEEKLEANGVKNRSKKQGSRSKVVDLRALLIRCAQSVAADDRRTATEQLQQIRQHSSSSGDSSKRLAHIFANGLEARLAGTGTQVYKALSAKQLSATEKLMAYNSYLSVSPILKFSFYFAPRSIYDRSLEAPKIHIIDFGIQYGFQWPMFIQLLSYRPGGPPELRITGIECPQPGFRPEERLQETGRRLASNCERFNVPFKYKAIAAQCWENIKIEDLKIKKDEFVAVNSLLRFENVLDETIVLNDSPRDYVLKLIRKIAGNVDLIRWLEMWMKRKTWHFPSKSNGEFDRVVGLQKLDNLSGEIAKFGNIMSMLQKPPNLSGKYANYPIFLLLLYYIL